MRESQLSVLDTANYEVARAGWITDWMMFWVFDNARGRSLTRDEISEQFQQRASLLEPMYRRVADVPGLVDYPYWIPDDADIGDHIDHQPEGLDWVACRERIGTLLGTALDARIQAWRVSVFADVHGIPSLEGSGTVVVLQVSHALMVGPAMPSVADAMFGSGSETVFIAGLGPKEESFTPVGAVARGIARMPIQMGRFAAAARAHRAAVRRTSTAAALVQPVPVPTLFNQHPGDLRTIRTFLLDLNSWRTPGLSVSAAGLTAISRAMQSYLDEHGESCPDSLACLATVAIRTGAEPMGVNRIGVAVVELNPDTPSITNRAQAIKASLDHGRELANSAESLNGAQLAAKMPFTLFRKALAQQERNPAAPPQANSMLTSINCKTEAELALGGRPLAFTGMVPALARNIALAHSLVGTGNVLTVSVLSSPAVVPDVDRYAAILEQSFREVREALLAQS